MSREEIGVMHALHREGVASHRYFDRDHDIAAIKLLPNEYFVTADELMLTTVLGSCVAACVRDPVAGVGGMNHFMLPAAGDTSAPVSASVAMRYGAYAMDVLLNALYAGGAKRERLEAKAFGGGMVLNDLKVGRIGEANANFIREYFAARDIALVAQDLGDRCPRRVHYFPASGRVLVKRFKRDDESLAERDVALARALAKAQQAAQAGLGRVSSTGDRS